MSGSETSANGRRDFLQTLFAAPVLAATFGSTALRAGKALVATK